jgi:hypothetical protein
MERGGIAATPFGEVGVSHLQVRERREKKQDRRTVYMVCLDKGEVLKAKTVASQDTFLNPQSCISHFALGAMSFSNPFSLVAEEATSPISSALYTSMNSLDP